MSIHVIEEPIEYVNGRAVSPQKYKGMTSDEIKRAKAKEKIEALNRNIPPVVK